ncbi:MAG: hypothetical protein N2D54_11525, partial [Chloroflexota bacterium]
MQIETIGSISEIEDLAADWRKLLNNSTSSVPFLTPEYLAAWWGHLGGGEWDIGELQVIVARQEDGRLIGIAPLFLTEKPGGETALMFIGSYEISDFLDFIARPEDLDDFLRVLYGHLSSPEAPDWDCLDLYNILDDSATLDSLAKLSKESGWQYRQEQLQSAPYIPLPESWDD